MQVAIGWLPYSSEAIVVNGIGNVDFMILFTYVNMASVLIRLVIRSGGAVLRGESACFLSTNRLAII